MGEAWENPAAGGPPTRRASKLKYKYLGNKKKDLPEGIYNPPHYKEILFLCKDYLPLGLTLSVGILQDLRLG